MKKLHLLLTVAITFSGSVSCQEQVAADRSGNNNSVLSTSKMKVLIGDKKFTATLYDNATAAAFKDRLPVTLKMEELNRNEKFADLSKSLPTISFNPGTIHTGDLMLYGSSTLVLFYKTFSTSYSYTKLARIDDVTGLEAAVGSGNVAVSFELQ